VNAHAISLPEAALLGLIEGLTEFLPISSTGHLVLAAEGLGLDLVDDGVKGFLIVIQAGALLAVAGLYRRSLLMMGRGLVGADPEGARLAALLLAAFAPAAIAGPLARGLIFERLFAPLPVALALAAGGVAMIAFEAARARRQWRYVLPDQNRGFDPLRLTFAGAAAIGLAQALALWPGMSRSMVTILAGLAVGLTPRAAAEFSFLLALPTLGGAIAYDLVRDWEHLFGAAGGPGLAAGFAAACLVAVFAVRAFVGFVSRYGLAAFGWYRLALAGVVLVAWSAG